jgi:pilus assembly protein CpaC
VDESKLIQMKGGAAPKSVTSDNARVFKADVLPDNPNVIKLTPFSPGRANLIMSDGKVTEIREVQVLDTDEELFQLQRKQMEKRREILLQLIRQVVPTANVDVILGLQRSKVAVGLSAVGAPAASGPNDNTVLTGTVILTGVVFETEKVHTIVDLANAVFAGQAQQAAPQGSGQAPGGGTPTGTVAPPPGPTGTVIGPQGPQGALGNRITVINSLRIAGVHQVELGVVMAVVNRSEARNMGFNWFNNTNTWFLTSFVNPAAGITSAIATAAAGAAASGSSSGTAPQFGFGVLNPNNGFSGFLQALRAENLVKILAEPRLLTLSGRPANFIDGGQIPVITSSTGGSTVTYLQFGTVVNFVPIVLGNGKIHLEVAASISSPNSAVGVSVATTGSIANAPGLTTRGAQVAVQLEDGQTLAIGGLIQNTVNGSTAKIPILGDLPYFGAAFRSVSYSETEEELLILVTPRLVDPMACNQLKQYPSRETRSPDDYELFLEGILESPRGRRAPCESGRYVAAHKVPGANDPPFPCGDSGRPGFSGCANGSCATGNCSSCTGQPMSIVAPPAAMYIEGQSSQGTSPASFMPMSSEASPLQPRTPGAQLPMIPPSSQSFPPANQMSTPANPSVPAIPPVSWESMDPRYPAPVATFGVPQAFPEPPSPSYQK